MSGEAKVLTGLLQRRALEQAFAELGRITEPAAVQRQAQTIAEYGSAALQHLLTLLDTPDPQLRGGLGQVARHLPRGQVVSALRSVVRDQARSDQARLAAVTLLERFLGESIDSSLIGDLGNPDAAARQSLVELVDAMDEEPLSVLEYLEQLGLQPPEVVDMVLDALPAVEASPHLATLLRMVAQGADPRLARRAVEELVKLRTPAAARALVSLVPNLPPTLAPAAERGLRKLSFSGVQTTADHESAREPWYAPELRWRALMSSLDPQGGQFIWFVGSEAAPTEGLNGADGKPTPGRAVFFTVLTRDPDGLLDASGSLEAKADQAPPHRRTGALHFIVGDDAQAGLSLLEAPFALALAALRAALSLNWASGTAPPLGYRLFSPLIWLAGEVTAGEDEAEDAEGREAEGALPEPDLALTEAELIAALEHPAFYGWFEDVEGVELSPVQSASYARRFRAMSRWLATAGDEVIARLTATLAYYLDSSTSEAGDAEGWDAEGVRYHRRCNPGTGQHCAAKATRIRQGESKCLISVVGSGPSCWSSCSSCSVWAACPKSAARSARASVSSVTPRRMTTRTMPPLVRRRPPTRRPRRTQPRTRRRTECSATPLRTRHLDSAPLTPFRSMRREQQWSHRRW